MAAPQKEAESLKGLVEENRREVAAAQRRCIDLYSVESAVTAPTIQRSSTSRLTCIASMRACLSLAAISHTAAKRCGAVQASMNSALCLHDELMSTRRGLLLRRAALICPVGPAAGLVTVGPAARPVTGPEERRLR